MTALILLKDFLETQIEIWRPIVSDDVKSNAYDVSNLGRVRGYLDLPKGNQYSGKTRRWLKEPRILKVNTTKDSTPERRGYGQICLQTPTGEKMFRVHLLVAKAFLLNSNNDNQVNHKNAIKCDNRLPNLEWSNHDHNHEHATVNGLRQSGEKHWAARLTADTVRAIRVEYDAGVRQVDIARKFSLTRTAVWQIVHRHIWKSIE
jgi:hypothetical protein